MAWYFAAPADSRTMTGCCSTVTNSVTLHTAREVVTDAHHERAQAAPPHPHVSMHMHMRHAPTQLQAFNPLTTGVGHALTIDLLTQTQARSHLLVIRGCVCAGRRPGAGCAALQTFHSVNSHTEQHLPVVPALFRRLSSLLPTRSATTNTAAVT